ncbi:MAG: DNA translocase FtsK, partial [Aquincola sp.]|nr:DNA translocase FtsK [Aquincola sp.]
MSFSLGTLRGDAPLPSGATESPRWRQQALLIAGALAWLLFLLAMATHHAGDTAFSTSGTGQVLQNKAGVLGARVSDMALFLFGFSAWWLVPVGLRAWLSALAR